MARKMKDSGIEWIGEIPEDWRIMSLKHSLKGLRTGINPRDNFQLGEGNNFYVTIKNFKDGKLFLDEKCDRITDDALKIINKRADLKVNDILFSSISDEGHIFLIKEKPKNWTINESVFSIRPNKKIIHPKFLAYILPKNYIFTELKSKETGSTFKSIKQDHLKDSKIVVTNMNEQRYIIQFLDKKVEQIENIESTIIQEIQTLEDYKKSLITEAVTKGLDKNVEMKDSGIEWIGKIPKHWELKRLKNFTKNRQGGAWGKDVDLKNENQNIICIRIADFDYPKMTIRKDREFTLRNYTKSEIAKYTLQKGDILVEKSGGGEKTPVGRTIIWNEDFKALYANFIERIRLDRDIVLPMYAQFCFYAFYGMGGSNLYFNQTTGLQNLDMSTMLNKLNFPIPKISEQNFIIDFLNKKTATIDEAIAAKKKQLETLEEYKKSLIYEYVTGKKEVEDVGTI